MGVQETKKGMGMLHFELERKLRHQGPSILERPKPSIFEGHLLFQKPMNAANPWRRTIGEEPLEHNSDISRMKCTLKFFSLLHEHDCGNPVVSLS